MIKIILASSNQGKIKEYSSLLKTNKNIVLISENDLQEKIEIKENGLSYAENAFLKANFYYQKYHLMTISDDSGLEIRSLNNRPGLYSSRFAKQYLTQSEANKAILKELENKNDRKAKFKCLICLINNNMPYYFYGECNGQILHQEEGDNGFGYDPIFISSTNVKFGMANEEEKNKISHRYQALKKLKRFLAKKIN